MPLSQQVDLCVIGAGAAGLSVAAGAAQLGIGVVLIEQDRMGGECLNTGCVPSKALLAAAKAAEMIRNAKSFGIDAEPLIDFLSLGIWLRSSRLIPPGESSIRPLPQNSLSRSSPARSLKPLRGRCSDCREANLPYASSAATSLVIECDTISHRSHRKILDSHPRET